ncbi:MAG: hypothetical protein EHM46_05065, partial [Bacteroidetes bacterium]
GEPLFPFGHGLSYTGFTYEPAGREPAVIREGDAVEIGVRVTNTGTFDSDEVVQMYVRFPDSGVARPNMALKGFRRVFVPAGQVREVTLLLHPDDLKYWDEMRNEWVLEKGGIEVMLGASSKDIRLRKMLTVR